MIPTQAKNTGDEISSVSFLSPHSNTEEYSRDLSQKVETLLHVSDENFWSLALNGRPYGIVATMPTRINEGHARQERSPGDYFEVYCSVYAPEDYPVDMQVWTNLPDDKSSDWHSVSMEEIRELPKDIITPAGLPSMRIFRALLPVPQTTGMIYGYTLRIKGKDEQDDRFIYQTKQGMQGNLVVGVQSSKAEDVMPRRPQTIWTTVSMEEILDSFLKAADTFVKPPDERDASGNVDETLAQKENRRARYDWEIWAASWDWFFEQWGRDTFIALPGLLLSTGRFDVAKAIMRSFGKFERNGVIPNRVWDPRFPENFEYNNADGSMWFVHAMYQYLEYTHDWEFMKEMLPTIRNIMKHYSANEQETQAKYERLGVEYKIYSDPDKLIVSPPQGTWSDAQIVKPGYVHTITPRNGKVVEINALFDFNLQFLALLEHKIGDKSKMEPLLEQRKQVRESFNEKFWNAEEGCLFDVVDGDPHGKAIRANMLFAVSLGNIDESLLDDDIQGDARQELTRALLSPERQISVFDVAHRELWTRYGPRTLSTRDSNYKPFYPQRNTDPEIKDPMYHQGTVWPWLTGPFIDAVNKVMKLKGLSDEQRKETVKKYLTPLVSFLMHASEARSLPEVFNGGDPNDIGLYQYESGPRSQAWSVSEVLRVMVDAGIFMPTPQNKLAVAKNRMGIASEVEEAV
ncbi:MAG: hypothetical protein JW774_00400 [Candidatus Aureabacteria bacterium]|nr:hypothetical protein [Candidatus Auribacterota bacterium]